MDPQCHAAWQERQGLQGTSPLLDVRAYWTAWNVPPSTVNLSPNGPIAVKMKCSMENSCLSITKAARLFDKIYNSLKSKTQNFLINYVGVSVYRHLNCKTLAVTNWCTKTMETFILNHLQLYDITIFKQNNKNRHKYAF